MNLITRCPACATMFKVVPDQLRVSDGWVRCGRCDEVFDANAHFQSLDTEHVLKVAPIASLQTADDDGYDWAEVLNGPSGLTFPDPQPAVAPDSADPEPLPSDEGWVDPFLHKSPAELSEPLAAPGAGPAPQDALLPTPQPGPARVQVQIPRFEQADSTLADDENQQAMSFMRPVPNPGAWQRRTARAMGAGLSLLLSATLVAQWMVHERDRLAIAAPATRPVLVALCGVLNCTLAPPRQIDALVIDGASFVKVADHVFKLGFNLRNTGALEVAIPAVELTLTDLQDQPVVRRVLQPSEIAARKISLAVGEEHSALLPIVVADNGHAEGVVGYRLLAFYP